ncbi:MAG TPA: hypothetical protein VMH00_16755 [Candidatus Limnocylindrales bacterium]|nr:hypothetical protein [Candidatus Limnocylindrales bacterium]
MADWRQIQARIRKAKNAADPSSKLNELFQRTRDGMVAWELAVLEEKNERMEEAVRWYTTAFQRFRRAEWKKKAEEALTRLGAEIPAADAASGAEVREGAATEVAAEASADAADEMAAPRMREEAEGESSEMESTAETTGKPAAAADSGPGGHKKRRRGHRGGRGRRKRGGAGAPSLPSEAFAKPAAPSAVAREAQESRAATRDFEEERPSARRESPRPAAMELPEPQLPSERVAHGRGDPALASRMARLESMLRRLLSSPLHKVDQVDEAPAGPGVFLLSDADQITSYYVENCQTLRVGLGNLVRGNRGRAGHRGASRSFPEIDLKEKLADHLGINQSKVSQYMKDHCVVRWIQLDDDAPHLAHFAISVLRTPLNLD